MPSSYSPRLGHGKVNRHGESGYLVTRTPPEHVTFAAKAQGFTAVVQWRQQNVHGYGLPNGQVAFVLPYHVRRARAYVPREACAPPHFARLGPTQQHRSPERKSHRLSSVHMRSSLHTLRLLHSQKPTRTARTFLRPHWALYGISAGATIARMFGEDRQASLLPRPFPSPVALGEQPSGHREKRMCRFSHCACGPIWKDLPGGLRAAAINRGLPVLKLTHLTASKVCGQRTGSSFMSVHAPNRLQNPKKPIRVVILDASRMGAQLLADALKGEQFEVVHGGSRVADAVAASDHADVVLLTAATAQQCLQACPLAPSFRAASKTIRIILLASEDPNRETVIEAFKAGIRGIFSCTTSIGDLRKCILAVVEGQVWASSRAVNYLLDALSEPPSMRLVNARGAELLSKREAEVVRCVSEGLTNREIADRLGLSGNTVKNYLFRIFDKLGVSTRVELIMYAIGNLAQQTNRGDLGAEVEPSGSPEAAAEQLIISLSSLEKMHRHGRGSPRDPASVYMWLLVAQELSPQVQMNSRTAANVLQRELTPRQRLQAERAAERWLRERQEGPESAAQAAASRSDRAGPVIEDTASSFKGLTLKPEEEILE